METISEIREKYIKKIEEDKKNIQILSDDLFNLGLNMYSKEFSFDSALFNSFAISSLDEEIILHKEQLKIINIINNNSAVIISAPTSFGKTFCIFEYIARFYPKNIVLIVPTLALVDEYLKKIIKKYTSKLNVYKTHINYDENKKYDFDKHNIFILTHDKVMECRFYNNIEKIDLLVIDEVYKLKTDETNDRVLVLNMAYKYLADKAEKYVLLAPFIKDIEDRNILSKQPIMYKSNFSPVVNELIKINLNSKEEKYNKTIDLLKGKLLTQKNLIYFSTVKELANFVNREICNTYPIINLKNELISNFLQWAKDEIHEDWYVIKAMERGFLVHNGQLPLGVRLMQIDLYEEEENFKNMLCTSTLLEGVNICSKNIIITSPQRNKTEFDAFDFYNLVGRTGRLNKHFLGYAYYLKGPKDKEYVFNDAIKTIKFELTDNESKDIDIINGNFENNEDFITFLNELNITYKDYIENIGYKYRFSTINELYTYFRANYSSLLDIINKMIKDETIGRYNLLCQLLKIIYCETTINHKVNIDSKIISYSLHKNRYSIKYIINKILEKNKENIDSLISNTIKLKYSMIEHQIYSKIKIVYYFLKCCAATEKQLNLVEQKILLPIEVQYFSNSEIRKNLKSLGVYEKDIENIINVIGEEVEDIEKLKIKLKENVSKFKISFLSKYVIEQL